MRVDGLLICSHGAAIARFEGRFLLFPNGVKKADCLLIGLLIDCTRYNSKAKRSGAHRAMPKSFAEALSAATAKQGLPPTAIKSLVLDEGCVANAVEVCHGGWWADDHFQRLAPPQLIAEMI